MPTKTRAGATSSPNDLLPGGRIGRRASFLPQQKGGQKRGPERRGDWDAEGAPADRVCASVDGGAPTVAVANPCGASCGPRVRTRIMADPNGVTCPGGLTALNLRVLLGIEAKMRGDRIDGAPAVPQSALSRRERYHARRLAARGRLRRVETDAPWFARRTVLYGSGTEPPEGAPPEAEPLAREPLAGGCRRVVREPTTVVSRSEARVAYRDALFSGVPLYTTRLVRERTFTFPTRDQVRSPAGAVAVLAEYFVDRDREEFVVAFLDTVKRD